MNRFQRFYVLVVFAVMISSCTTASVVNEALHDTTRVSSNRPSTLNEHENIENRDTDFTRIGDTPQGQGQIRIFFNDDNSAWLWRRKALWKSQNGGKEWILAQSFDDKVVSEILDVFFETGQIGWLVTGTSVYKSLDGGSSWAKDPFFTGSFEGTIMSVSVSRKSKIILLGGSDVRHDGIKAARSVEGSLPAIFWSNDGGINWKRSEVPTGLGAITKIRFINDLDAIAIGEFSHNVYTSGDQGRTWKQVKFGSECVSPDFQRANEYKPMEIAYYGQSVWLSFNDGRISVSSDNGRKWCDMAQPKQIWKENDKGLAYFTRLCFINQNLGWGVKANGELYKTSSGGAQWSLLSIDSNYGDMFFSNGSCYFASDHGIFKMTG